MWKLPTYFIKFGPFFWEFCAKQSVCGQLLVSFINLWKEKNQNILSDCLNFLCCCKIYFLTKWPFYHNFVVFERNADSYFPCIVVIQWNSIFIFNPILPISTFLWGLGLQDGLINLISRKQLYLTKLCKSV